MSLRVLVLMDPYIKVPPEHYGGIERVVADLADGLTKHGHDVTLWAAPGSSSLARVEPFGCENEWTRWSNIRNTAILTARFLERWGRFDVIHNFGRLVYLAAVLRANVPKVQTYMRSVNPQNMRRVLMWGARKIHFTGVSAAIRDTGSPGGGEWSVVYNCAPTAEFELTTDVDPETAPLVFLGRLERCKGAHTAIAVARKLNRTLTIAGNLSTLPEEKAYFHREIEPLIDGRLVKYVGPVANEEKKRLLGGAAALLLPIEWLEPFPVVLPEALLCGTPVIGFRRGGVPEGIEEGVTGFLCDTTDEMADRVGRLGEIDRARCREEAERRFSDRVIVEAYESLYRRLLGGRG